jgi:hypothetical protein
MNQKPLVWVLVAIAVLVLAPLLGMIAMMGMGTGMAAMMGGGMTCCSGTTGWALAWMLLVAALIVALIILLVRSVNRS